MNRGEQIFCMHVASVFITYSLNCLRWRSPYRALSFYDDSISNSFVLCPCFLSCLFLYRHLVSWCPLVWCILVFDCNSKRYNFELSFQLVNRLNFSKNWFRTVCTIYQISSINSVPHVVDTIENVLWSSCYCPRINAINSVSHVADTIGNVIWSSCYCPLINNNRYIEFWNGIVRN